MRPKWFTASPSSPGSFDPPIPYKVMWEESGEWLPVLLSFYFPDPKGADQIQVVHHVTFKGGHNPETGLEDVWHGMDLNFMKWLGDGKKDEDGFPGRLEDWTEEIRERWIEGRRKVRFDAQ